VNFIQARRPVIENKMTFPGAVTFELFNNNNNSVFQGGPVIYIYIIHGKLYYAYLKTIKYLQMDYI
jgi:hypothetical protein